MSILINKDTKVICQGFTGQKASFHSQQALNYGTKIMGGVTPGKGGQTHLGLPVFDTVLDAIDKTNATTSIIYVPAIFCKDAILEAIHSGIQLIVCITEGVPILDMLLIKHQLQKNKKCIMIGPNCPGIITVNQCKVGIMPDNIYRPGNIGIISRSGTLTYEVIKQITDFGLGQSTCVGIGGDPVLGSNFIDILKLFEEDSCTSLIVMIGEIGGKMEEKAAIYIKKYITKPVIAYIAGATAPKGKRMGHAGAIISGTGSTAQEKFEILLQSGIHIVKNFVEIGITVKNFIDRKNIN